ncbi:MAG: prepilin peptidase [Candidatus Micrarchaeia archaeon]
MLELLKIVILLVFAFVYAYFDIFNKRNIPNKFAYLSLAFGIFFTFLNPMGIILYSLIIAAFILASGYLLYKGGLLGLGDGFEFAFISLMLPVQPQPVLGVQQFGLPFALSVFVSSGIVAIVAIPLYYILKTKKSDINIRSIEMASLVFVSYLLLLMVFLVFGAGLIAIALILVIAFFSALLFLVEGTLKKAMVRWVYPKELDDGDIIAVNLLSKNEFSFFKSKSKHFGKLVDTKNMNELKRIKKKLPVYKNAVPFSVFILAGAIVALVLGNPLLLIFI